MNSWVDDLTKSPDESSVGWVAWKEIIRLRVDFVEILDDGYTFYQFGAIGQYESRYSLGKSLGTVLGLICLYYLVRCSPFKRLT